MNLTARLTALAASHPGRAALIEGSGRRRRAMSFAELEDRVAAGAGTLQERGLRPGQVVLFLHPVDIELFVALLAAMRTGAVALFIDPSARREVVRSALRRLAPRAFFASPKAHLWRVLHPAVRRIPFAFATVPWIPGARWPGRGARGETATCGASAPALITFTSGSTGEPRAVVRSHGFLQAQYEVLRSAIALREGEIDLLTLPVFGLANLAAGLTTVIAETDLRRPGRADGGTIGQQIAREGVTRCAASPAFFQSLLRQRVDLRGMRKIYTGGAPVFPSLLEQLAAAAPQAEVEAVYGSTEAEPIAHVEVREIGAFDLESMRAGGGLLAGRPVHGIRLEILPNRWGRPWPEFSREAFRQACLPAEAPGEIVVSGEHVLTGYLDGVGDEETKFRVDGRVWHRTGDAGWKDADGRLWLLGRAGAVIRREDGDLYPFAVETALSFAAGVRRSALAEVGGRAVLALEWAGTERDVETVRKAVAWAGLESIVPVRRIPLDRRHQAKVDYPALRKLLEERG